MTSKPDPKEVVRKVEEWLSHDNNLASLRETFEEADILAKELTSRSDINISTDAIIKNNMFKDITLTPQPMSTAPKNKPIHCWTEYGFGLCEFDWDDDGESEWRTTYNGYSVNPIAWVEMPTGVEIEVN